MKVKVYSTNTCPYCHMVKEFLSENKVEFDDINVQDDPEASQEMVRISGQMGVPVINIDGNIIVGFDKDKIIELLKLSVKI